MHVLTSIEIAVVHFKKAAMELLSLILINNLEYLLMKYRFEEVTSLMSELEEDMEKFYEKGNKAAGTRARKQLQELKNLAQDIRLHIQAVKNEEM